MSGARRKKLLSCVGCHVEFYRRADSNAKFCSARCACLFGDSAKHLKPLTKDGFSKLSEERKKEFRIGHRKYIEKRVLSPLQIETLKKGAVKGAIAFRMPEVREKAYESIRKTYASGNYKKLSPERYSENGKYANSKVDYRKQCNANKRLGELRRGKPNPPGRSEAGINHWKSKMWRLRNPLGVEITGKNLNQIIRDNSTMFEANEVIWKNSSCIASKGIRGLFAKSGRNCSWHGWVGVAMFETEDLLDRNELH